MIDPAGAFLVTYVVAILVAVFIASYLLTDADEPATPFDRFWWFWIPGAMTIAAASNYKKFGFEFSLWKLAIFVKALATLVFAYSIIWAGSTLKRRLKSK